MATKTAKKPAEMGILTTISIDLIDAGNNVRDRYDPGLSDEAIYKFAFEDLRHNGIRNPLSLVEKESGRYEVVAGHRRLAAARLLNENNPGTFSSLPAIVRKSMSSMDKVLTMLADRNSAPLTPLGQAEVLRRLIDDEGLSQSKAAEHLGVSVAYAGDMKLLANAPAVVQDRVRNDNISATQAVALMKELGFDQASEVIEEAIKEAEAEAPPVPVLSDAEEKPEPKKPRVTKAKLDKVKEKLKVQPKVSQGKGKPRREVHSEDRPAVPAPAPQKPSLKPQEALNRIMDKVDVLMARWPDLDADPEGYREAMLDLAVCFADLQDYGYIPAVSRSGFAPGMEPDDVISHINGHIGKAEAA